MQFGAESNTQVREKQKKARGLFPPRPTRPSLSTAVPASKSASWRGRQRNEWWVKGMTIELWPEGLQV